MTNGVQGQCANGGYIQAVRHPLDIEAYPGLVSVQIAVSSADLIQSPNREMDDKDACPEQDSLGVQISVSSTYRFKDAEPDPMLYLWLAIAWVPFAVLARFLHGKYHKDMIMRQVQIMLAMCSPFRY